MHSQLNPLLASVPLHPQKECSKLAIFPTHRFRRVPGLLEAKYARAKLDVGRLHISTCTCVPSSYQECAQGNPNELYNLFGGGQNKAPFHETEEQVRYIKTLLSTMDDGRISISAYDTAWVALVEDIHGRGTPQFPACLEWIANNQLHDGSWGDSDFFSAYDRLLNTLACLIALKSWDIHHDKFKKGISFMKENINKLEMENYEHMIIGFEVVFPSLIERAQTMGIEIPCDSPALREIIAKRKSKLAKIPMEMLHNKHTLLLFSLEGLEGLDWEKLLKLQSLDGSFFGSPSSTAFAFMHTKDLKCLSFLNRLVERFNGGVPNIYPVDIYAMCWAVDRLQRLGICRFFQEEINNCISYVYRYWSDNRGVFSGRDWPLPDIDDTTMAFRLLRLHGRKVSADVFLNFKNGDEFQCFPMQQSWESVTTMFGLYRASQIRFPGEKILEEANVYSFKLLRERKDKNQLRDKWVISKDLPGEIGYALDMPWYASLPRVEARYYIEQYGGNDDVWIGKTLYRMFEVNNDAYLELAKLDFNKCQAQHRLEWNNIHNWYTESGIGKFGISTENVLFAYFLAAANIYEPSRSIERAAWVKSAILVEMVTSFYSSIKFSGCKQRRAISILQFQNYTTNMNHMQGHETEEQRLEAILVETLQQISVDTLEEHAIEIYPLLQNAWEMWLTKFKKEVLRREEAELLVHTLCFSTGRLLTEIKLSQPQYKSLSKLTNDVCNQLSENNNKQVHAINTGKITSAQIESNMQELVQLVLQNSLDGIDHHIKQTFFTIARSYYYSAYCAPETIRMHIAKVLFEELV